MRQGSAGPPGCVAQVGAGAVHCHKLSDRLGTGTHWASIEVGEVKTRFETPSGLQGDARSEADPRR